MRMSVSLRQDALTAIDHTDTPSMLAAHRQQQLQKQQPSPSGPGRASSSNSSGLSSSSHKGNLGVSALLKKRALGSGEAAANAAAGSSDTCEAAKSRAAELAAKRARLAVPAANAAAKAVAKSVAALREEADAWDEVVARAEAVQAKVDDADPLSALLASDDEAGDEAPHKQPQAPRPFASTSSADGRPSAASALEPVGVPRAASASASSGPGQRINDGSFKNGRVCVPGASRVFDVAASQRVDKLNQRLAATAGGAPPPVTAAWGASSSSSSPSHFNAAAMRAHQQQQAAAAVQQQARRALEQTSGPFKKHREEDPVAALAAVTGQYPTLGVTPQVPFTPSRTHPHALSPTFAHSHALSRTFTHSHALSCTLPQTISNSHALSRTLSHILMHSHKLSRTLTHTHAHA
jgi:hypothetical protein